MKKIAFRVDGGPDIGMGHIMRCLALAQGFPDNIDIIFIIKESKSVKKIINNYSFRTISIDKDMEYDKKEINLLKRVIRDNNIDILISDSYKIDKNYLDQLKGEVEKLVSIHDFVPFDFPSDIVINGNIYAPDLNYNSTDGDTMFLLGTDYTLLRKEFWNLPNRNVKKEVENILITVGGGDLLNLTPKIVKALHLLEKDINEVDNININKLAVNIIIGSSFNNIEEIIKEVEKSTIEIKLNFNIKRMSQIMINSDLAISAGGSTLYELAMTGTPTIALLQADNQKLVAEAMEREGIIKNLGFGNQITEYIINKELQELIANYHERRLMFRNGKDTINKRSILNCVSNILA